MQTKFFKDLPFSSNQMKRTFLMCSLNKYLLIARFK